MFACIMICRVTVSSFGNIWHFFEFGFYDSLSLPIRPTDNIVNAMK